MKLTQYLSLFVSVIVLSAWSFQLNRPSVFRGGTATNMSEEFATYGLDDSIMIGVGISKVILALLLLLGGVKFPKYIKPAAAGMALFMLRSRLFPPQYRGWDHPNTSCCYPIIVLFDLSLRSKVYQ